MALGLHLSAQFASLKIVETKRKRILMQSGLRSHFAYRDDLLRL